MDIEIKNWKKDQTISRIVKSAFPRYNKQKVYISASDSVCLMNLNWDSGSRSEYRIVSIEGEYISDTLRYSTLAPWNNKAEGVSLPSPQGFVVVRGGIFYGKESTLTLHVNPSDMPKYLPKPV